MEVVDQIRDFKGAYSSADIHSVTMTSVVPAITWKPHALWSEYDSQFVSRVLQCLHRKAGTHHLAISEKRERASTMKKHSTNQTYVEHIAVVTFHKLGKQWWNCKEGM